MKEVFYVSSSSWIHEPTAYADKAKALSVLNRIKEETPDVHFYIVVLKLQDGFELQRTKSNIK